MSFREKTKTLADFTEGVAIVGIPFMGFGLVRLWLLNLSAGGLMGGVSLDLNLVFWCVLLAAIAALTVFSKQRRSLHDSGPIVIGSLACLLVGLLLFVVGESLGADETLAILGTVLSSAGYAGFLLLWFELFGCISTNRMVFAYACSNILGAAIWQLLSSMSPVAAYAMLFVLPIISAIALFVGFNKPEAAREAQLVTAESSAFPSLRTLARIIIWIACFSLATGFFLSYRTTVQVSLAYVITGVLIILGMVLFSKRFDFSILYRMSLPFIVIGLIVAPFMPAESALASLFVSIGKEAALAIALAIACNIAYRRRISAAWTAGAVYFANIAAMLLGILLQRNLDAICEWLHVPSFTFLIAMCVLCIVAAALVFNENHFYLHWEGTELATGNARERENRIDSVVGEISADAGLSAREKEILSLMARDKSYADIGTELFISPATVRVHANHIFGKLGVANREALLSKLRGEE